MHVVFKMKNFSELIIKYFFYFLIKHLNTGQKGSPRFPQISFRDSQCNYVIFLLTVDLVLERGINPTRAVYVLPWQVGKSAIFGLTANLVSELSQYNILINDVVPSWTLTDNARKLFDQQFQQTAKMAFPTQRITTPDDIPSVIAYLGSKTNGHVNSEQIKVTGSGSQAMLNYFFQQMMAENKQS